jgi:hypothetical protein
MKPNALIEVTWRDHVFTQGPLDPTGHPRLVKSVGYFVKWDTEQLVIAQSLGLNSPEECLHLMSSCVERIVRLRPRRH